MTSKDSTTKVCTTCFIEKDLSVFSKRKASKDGLQPECKSCVTEYKNAYIKTKEGVATAIYGQQRESSRNRGHALPNYSKELFKLWLFSQYKFHYLYDKWVESGYQKRQKPSCDRLDDYKPYTFENLQLMTWQENKDKYFCDVKNGINNKKSKSVIQMDLDGNFIAEHHSTRHAERVTGTCQTHISDCCKGNYKTSGGYKWQFKVEAQ